MRDIVIFLKAKQNNGFTLLEVMVSLAIIATSLVILLGLRNRDSALHEYSGDLLQATLLAKERMVDQELVGFPDLGDFRGDFDEENFRFSWRQIVSPTPFESVREVEVVVNWKRGNREESVHLTSYFFKKD